MTTRWEVERALFVSDLSSQARLVALTLLALTNPQSCVVPAEFTPSLTKQEKMTGLGRSTLARALNELEEAGWVRRRRPEVEKARTEGERTRYRLGLPPGWSQSGTSWSQSGTSPSATAGLDLVPERDAYQTAFQTNNQQQNSPPKTSPESVVSEATGANAEEAAAIVKRVQNERQPRNVVGLLKRMAADGDLGQFLVEHRAALIKARVAEELAEARRGPECDHGVPGGQALHPTARTPLCPQCRAHARRYAA